MTSGAWSEMALECFEIDQEEIDQRPDLLEVRPGRGEAGVEAEVQVLAPQAFEQREHELALRQRLAAGQGDPAARVR